jgi:photosystem II stability/assembly factor-like uncharacterized protein
MKRFLTYRATMIILVFSLFYSVDGLCQWQKFGEPCGASIYSIARVDHLLFAGGGHLFVSDDNGNSWEIVETFPGSHISNLLGYDGCLIANTFNGLFRSLDHGVSWNKSELPAGETYIRFLCQSDHTMIVIAGNSGSFSMIYLSDDYGDTWSVPETPFNSGLTSSLQAIHDGVYACTADGVYRSVDSGHHWELFTSEIRGYPALTYANNQFIAVDMFLCRRSADGIAWDTVRNDIFRPHCLLTLDSAGSNGQRILMGSWSSGWEGGYPGGLFYSDNNGSNWWPVGEVNDRNDHINCLLGNGIETFVATGTEGIMRSTDHAGSWQLANKGLTYREFYKVAAEDSVIFVTSRNETEQFLSTDRGQSWQYQDLPDISGDPSLHSIITAGNRLWIATSGGLYFKKLTDSAWHVVMPDSSFHFLAHANQVVYAATRYTLYRTADQGETWTVCNDSSGLPYIRGISANENTIVAVLLKSVMYSDDCGDHFYSTGLPVFLYLNLLLTNDGKDFFIACESRGVFMSSDNGVNWENVNDTAFRYLYGIAAGNGCVFISTRDGGVIRSTDKGRTWTSYNEGFPGYIQAVNGLALSGDTLYAVGRYNGEIGLGINRRSSFPTGITLQKETGPGLHVHPNPVTGSFTVTIHGQPLSGVPYVIVSGTGMIVAAGRTGSNGNVGVENFAPGAYVVEIHYRQRRYANSFVKI